MISNETKDRIVETAIIEEVVGDFVNLKRRGSSYLGLCPFHNEKTPSFTVTPARGIFKCFGCGQGGDSVKFVMEHEHYTFPEALRYLAKKYSIEVEEEEMSPEMEAVVSERESQFVVMSYAEQWFIDQLHQTDEGKNIGLSYYHERGFRDDIIEKFRLGYSPETNKGFTTAATEAGYKLDYLKKTGLTKESERGTYDGYRGRVMFPIHNLSGRVIGFGGRTLKKDKKVPKYVNTPECDIYHKSKELYGIYFAKRTIVGNDNCFLVEGYTDVISLHQAGVENVVASSGTSLTHDQIRLIKRYTPNITILFDGDAAGIKASFRGIDMILSEGMNVKIVLFPEGEDPDSYARAHSSSEIEAFISDNAKDFIVFKTDVLSADVGNDPIKKAGLIHEIIESIALIPDLIARQVYVKECSRLLDMPEQTLLTELNKEVRKKHQKDQRARHPDDPGPMVDAAVSLPDQMQTPAHQPAKADDCARIEYEIVRLLLTYHDKIIKVEVDDPTLEVEVVEVSIVGYVLSELQQDEIALDNALYQLVLAEFSSLVVAETTISANHFSSHTDQEVSHLASEMLTPKYELHDWARHHVPVRSEEDNLERLVKGNVYALKEKRVRRMMMAQMAPLKNKSSDEEALLQAMKFKRKLDKVRSEIGKIQGRVIIE